MEISYTHTFELEITDLQIKVFSIRLDLLAYNTSNALQPFLLMLLWTIFEVDRLLFVFFIWCAVSFWNRLTFIYRESAAWFTLHIRNSLYENRMKKFVYKLSWTIKKFVDYNHDYQSNDVFFVPTIIVITLL